MDKLEFLELLKQEEKRLLSLIEGIRNLAKYYESEDYLCNPEPKYNRLRPISSSTDINTPMFYDEKLSLSKKIIFILKEIGEGKSYDVYNKIVEYEPFFDKTRVQVTYGLAALFRDVHSGVKRIDTGRFNHHTYIYKK